MQTWTVHRGEIASEHGLVAAQNMEAAAAGAAVLSRGGNAMDAAVVTALVLALVEPWLSGIGGGGFLLHADGDTGALSALDFSVRAPAGLDPDDYPLTGGNDGNWFDWPTVEDDRNIIGYSSICVPGTIEGLAQALERFGTLSWSEARAAGDRDGRARHGDRLVLLALHRHRRAAAAPLSCGGGAFSRRRRRAACLIGRELSADAGPGGAAHDGFAITAPAISTRARRRISSSRSCAEEARPPRWRIFPATVRAGTRPQLGPYRGRTIAVVPGLSGGPSLLRAFALLEKDWQPGSEPDADAALAYAVAIRDSYRERLNQMGHAGQGGDCTSHLSVVDRHGNMVALTNTLLSRFGSKVVLPESGILMNNGMMWFDPRRNMPNSISPGAQPLANMCPVDPDAGRQARDRRSAPPAAARSSRPWRRSSPT